MIELLHLEQKGQGVLLSLLSATVGIHNYAWKKNSKLSRNETTSCDLTLDASSSFTRSSAKMSLAFSAAISCSMGITTDRSFSASSCAFQKVQSASLKRHSCHVEKQTFDWSGERVRSGYIWSFTCTIRRSQPFSSHPPGSAPPGPL